MTLEATTTFDREALLDEVVTAYLKEARAGRAPEPEAWLARYPELAPELAEFFADRAAVERLAGPLRSVTPAGPPADGLATTSCSKRSPAAAWGRCTRRGRRA